MAVTGPGLDEAMTEVDKHQGNAVILEIASDKKSVILSQVAGTSSTNASFKVLPPSLDRPLLYTPKKAGDPGYPLITDLNFATPYEDGRDPYQFAQKVYLIMASMNQIGKANNNNVNKFMQDVIGANMGFIFENEMKKTDDSKMVTAMIRDMIKSVLRGVSDFTIYPDTVDASGKHTSWYPDPAKETGGQKFNVFNLDPFVWFVHVQLGFSGYGFSVDDDTADVGAGGATQLQLAVTSTGGLKNTNPWTIQAPYGPVKNVSCTYSGPGQGDTLYNAIKDVSGNTISPINITTKGQHNLANADKVVIDQVQGNTAANGNFKVANATKNTFDLVNPDGTNTTGNGAYTSGTGRWSYPLHRYIDTGADLTKVFYRVTGDDALGTFQGTFVSANGVDRNKTTKKKFRVWQLGRQKLDQQTVGRLLLDADLTDAYGVPLPAGTYNFTFFGVAETGPGAQLGAIRSDIREEIRQDRQGLDALREIEVPEEGSIRRWLRVEIAVLQARLDYPADHVLEKLDQMLDTRTSLSGEARRNILARLHARLRELKAGG